MLYTTRQIKVQKTELLDVLAHEAGIVYTNALVTFKRILRKKGVWLSKYGMQRLIRNTNLHSQTVQGIIDVLYDNINSWRKLRKISPNARLPKRRKWFFVIPFKESAIKIKDGKLILSNGKTSNPITLDWKFDMPKHLTISFNVVDMCYVINAVYAVETPTIPDTGIVAGIDLGEIHIAVANMGAKTIIVNGRMLRSKRRYQNKVKGSFQKRMCKLKKGSRKYKQINKKKKRVLKKLNNQIKDILHKQTTKHVNALKENGVNMVAIGDIKNIRQSVDYGTNANQRIHQMVSGKTRIFIEYKCAKAGIDTEVINEAYSSQTCPKCLNRHKPSNRNYKCTVCEFEYHRDGVGAINIRSKKMYLEYAPVVGEMTPPVGIRYIA